MFDNLRVQIRINQQTCVRTQMLWPPRNSHQLCLVWSATTLTTFGSATGATDRNPDDLQVLWKGSHSIRCSLGAADCAFTPVCQTAEMSPTLDKVVRVVARFAFGNKSRQDDLEKLSDFSQKIHQHGNRCVSDVVLASPISRSEPHAKALKCKEKHGWSQANKDSWAAWIFAPAMV